MCADPGRLGRAAFGSLLSDLASVTGPAVPRARPGEGGRPARGGNQRGTRTVTHRGPGRAAAGHRKRNEHGLTSRAGGGAACDMAWRGMLYPCQACHFVFEVYKFDASKRKSRP